MHARTARRHHLTTRRLVSPRLPQIVQHVTGFVHYLQPPMFGFSLPMHVLMYLRDGPGGTKLIAKQVGGVLCSNPSCSAEQQMGGCCRSKPMHSTAGHTRRLPCCNCCFQADIAAWYWLGTAG
jgi:hypothetical protein